MAWVTGGQGDKHSSIFIFKEHTSTSNPEATDSLYERFDCYSFYSASQLIYFIVKRKDESPKLNRS